MKKNRYGMLGITFLCILLSFTSTLLAFECVAPVGQNCLQCHVRTDIHNFHWNEIGLTDPAECSLCHSGDPLTSACEDLPHGYAPVETSGCANCHSQCYEVQNHIPRSGNCTTCHAQTNIGLDDDCDGICNPGIVDVSCTGSDNCSSNPNGPLLGTCTKGVVGRTCVSNDQCGTGGFCSTNQDDTYPLGGNNCGNVCECEGNFSIDVDVDGGDAATFKANFGRGGLNRPCTNGDLCNGDFTCDGNVSGSDAALFKSDFGRNAINNPCSSCATDPWCVY